MKNKVKFSIIIPVREFNHYLEECIGHIENQSYQNFEIIVLLNKINKKIRNKNIRVFETGDINPGDKRDLGAKKAKGEILVFIDDDAYPDKKWLENSLEYFKDEAIGAVGGPGLTPKEDPFMQKMGGLVLDSWLTSGNTTYRTSKKKERFVDDYPSFNFFIKKSLFEKIGGFDCEYWRGEDTKLCLKIIKANKKIIYSPKIIVYHHRRKLFVPHLHQVWKCSSYRGFFMKKYPKNSLKLSYLVPALFVIWISAGWIFSLFSSLIKIGFIGILILYLILLFISSMKTKNLFHNILIMAGIYLTHLVYGIGTIKGLLSRSMK